MRPADVRRCIKGPHFAALHPLFDQFATELDGFNDGVAERMLTLGGLAVVNPVRRTVRRPVRSAADPSDPVRPRLRGRGAAPKPDPRPAEIAPDWR
ncbi:MAG: hypothetical protein IPK26_10405 [Planctomycetes bacterium]|nr:hypothetical protein [Planctomycetota bacterium]